MDRRKLVESPADGLPSDANGADEPARRARARPPGGDSDPLPILHRAAIAYLAVPLAIWALGWFKPWIGVPATALLAAALWRALSGSRMPRPSRPAVAAAAVALAVVIPGPTSGLFLGASDWHAYPDWHIHRAVLMDMAQGAWPTTLAGYLDGEAPLLRYYLGWHLVPALAARTAGAAALDWAVPAWTWCGTALAAMLFARGLSTARSAALAAAGLFLFSGMDAMDALLLRTAPGMEYSAPAGMVLEYQPHLETLHVTPQHFLPAALGTLLLLQLRRSRRFWSVAGVVLAACLFWSSLLSVGLLVLGAAAAGVRRLAWTLSWQNLAAVPLALLAALYMAAGTIEFPHGWLWDLWESPWRMWMRLFVLYATEFLVLAVLVWRLSPSVARDPLFLASCAVLLAAPLYYYGSPTVNELGLRLPVPPLVVLSYYAIRGAAGRLGTGVAPGLRSEKALRGGARNDGEAGSARRLAGSAGSWLVASVLLVGAVPVMAHVAGLRPAVPGHARAGMSVRADIAWWDVRRLQADRRPGSLLDALLRDSLGGERSRAPGRLVVRSAWDVYLEQGNRLVYVKRDCDLEVEPDSWLFLEVRPQEAQRQFGPPASRRERARWIERPNDLGGRTLWLRVARGAHYVAGRGGCVAVADLASRSAERFRTGQLDGAGRLMWEAEVELRR